ncbi:hypothetical protein BD414DRAFT_574886 [Trametes punicea]|nr:hypothetical protein BD414DRAFT_574886 [Trametes punicea]
MTEVLAVACVIESSLALAAEWPQVQAEYIVPLLQRLGEVHRNPAFRIAFVSYGTADTLPTPVLSKVFFSPPQPMMKDMREEPHKLGIGQTGSGGGFGMAALEGLVAAIELFDSLAHSLDTLRSSTETAVTCHLIHFACSPPDPAERPLWNVSTALDSVTWETLPFELKKRGIHYSSVLLRQIPRFTQLQAAAAIGPVQSPWFSVRPPHALHLSGFPQKGTKRPGSVDRSPEIAKRAKVQSSPLKSPAILSATTSSPPQPPALATAKTPSIPPAVPSTTSAPAATSSLPRTLPPDIKERFRIAQETLKALAGQVQLLERQGRTEEAARMREDLTAKMEKYQLFRAQYAQRMNANVAAAANAGMPPKVSTEAARPSSAADVAAQMEPPRAPAQASAVPPAVPAPGAQAAPSTVPKLGGQISGMQVPQNMSPELAAQMQKLLEQQKNGPSHLGLQPPAQTQARPPAQTQPQPQPPAQALSQPQTQSTGAISTSPEKAAAAGPSGARPHSAPSIWRGTLSWSGFDAETHVKKDVQAGVQIVGQNPELMRAETWPAVLSLAPSQHHAVPVGILHAWMQRQKCIPLVVHATTDGQDAKKNDEHFRSLLRLLTEKNVYALASWSGPNGVPENRVLLFILKGNLAGVYFYLPGGMPELPKPEIGGIPLANVPPQFAMLLSSMGPREQAALEKLSQDKKMMYIKGLVQRTAKHQQQLQHGQQSGQQQQQQQGQQAGQQQPQGQPQSAQPQQMLPQQQQPVGPSQLSNAARNLPPGAPNIRLGEFNPWVQNTGPNISAMLNAAATGPPSGMSNSVQQQQQPNPAQQNLMANLGLNFGGMGQVPQQSQQGATGIMPGQGMGMGASMGMGMGMGMGAGLGMGAQGMHRRTPSAGSQTGMPPGVSYEMMHSFMQRNQEGGTGPNHGLGGM